MELLTIGAFAAASRLSPKALRLYDELGLLPPAHVDPETGYRLYAPAQLERARLVAWLRRLDMPLATIREVCESRPLVAARQIAAFWSQVEVDTAIRRDLAGLLVDQLSGRTSAGGPLDGAGLEIQYAMVSDAGLVRSENQDAGHADHRLLAVADGFGPEGAFASNTAVDAVRAVAARPGIPAGQLLNALQDAATSADRAIADRNLRDEAVGSTLTALLWTGSQLALVHVGDSRAYLLRDGELFQITHDHSLVQSMVDDGRLSPAEASSHPQRGVVAAGARRRTGHRA